jgi:hypothetical protein
LALVVAFLGLRDGLGRCDGRLAERSSRLTVRRLAS